MVDLYQNKKRCTANSMYIQNRSIRGVQGGGVVKYNILIFRVYMQAGRHDLHITNRETVQQNTSDRHLTCRCKQIVKSETGSQ